MVCKLEREKERKGRREEEKDGEREKDEYCC